MKPGQFVAPRRGAAAVEAALVLGIFFVLLFGAFEYCRYLMVLHVANNAARDGARFATVNVSNENVTRDTVIEHTRRCMGGTEKNINGFAIVVYPYTAGEPSNPADPNNPPWNQASFTEGIAVTIRGSYEPVTPLLLFLPPSIPITITAVMGSEG